MGVPLSFLVVGPWDCRTFAHRDGPMARPLRIEYEGTGYHVMNRGNQRLRAFHRDAHYELFVYRPTAAWTRPRQVE